jgi:hypothetical protein
VNFIVYFMALCGVLVYYRCTGVLRLENLRSLCCVLTIENFICCCLVAGLLFVLLCYHCCVLSAVLSSLCNTHGYPIPARYLMGTGTGMVMGGDELRPRVLSRTVICSTRPILALLPSLIFTILH